MNSAGLTFRPGVGRPKGFDANVQAIASAAHLRGVVLMRQDQVVGSLEAALLCRQLRLAHEMTRPGNPGGDADRHDHVERLANGIAVKLGARGSVEVSRLCWNLLLGYGTARTRRAAGPSEAREPAPSRKGKAAR